MSRTHKPRVTLRSPLRENCSSSSGSTTQSPWTPSAAAASTASSSDHADASSGPTRRLSLRRQLVAQCLRRVVAPHPPQRPLELERFNREIARRTDVVGIFPDDASLIRLASMLAIEFNDEWLVGRSYISQ